MKAAEGEIEAATEEGATAAARAEEQASCRSAWHRDNGSLLLALSRDLEELATELRLRLWLRLRLRLRLQLRR